MNVLTYHILAPLSDFLFKFQSDRAKKMVSAFGIRADSALYSAPFSSCTKDRTQCKKGGDHRYCNHGDTRYRSSDRSGHNV